MDRFKYILVKQPDGSIKKIEDFLNTYGEDGWELTCHDYGCFIFKRRIKE